MNLLNEKHLCKYEKDTKGGIQSIVVGEISVDELQSFDTALSTGLGLSKTPRPKLLSQTDLASLQRVQAQGAQLTCPD